MKEGEMSRDPVAPRTYSGLFLFLAALFVAALIVANTVATKIVMVGPLAVAAGILCFPVSYILSDVVTEVYGYRAARTVIWTAFACLAFTTLVYFLATALPPAPFYTNEEAFDSIFSQVPRIALGSLSGFLVGSFLNAAVMSKMKIWTEGRHLWARTIGSTVVGEAADSLVFAMIAFAGLFAWSDLLMIAFSGFVLKTAYEVLATPFTYWLVGWVKRRERLDTYDHNISYSPL
jgi:queuosine precursor transporter